MQFTSEEMDMLRGLVGEGQRHAVMGYASAPKPSEERDFYSRNMDLLAALRAKFEALLIADTSQDAEPDEDEDEDKASVQP